MRWIPASVLIASIAFATVPYTFPTGVPAKASQVNRNFEALDSLVNAQVERLAELREQLVAQSDSLRKELAALKQVGKSDSLAAVRAVPAPSIDTSWKSGVLPKGSVIGLIAVAEPDGFLAGSDKTWQSVESYGAIEGLPQVVAATQATPAPKIDSAVASVPADSLHAAPATAPPAAKQVLHWFVKVK